MKATMKPLTTLCNSRSKRLKPEKVLTPSPSTPAFLSCWSDRSASMLGGLSLSLFHDPKQKALAVLWTLARGKKRGKG